MKKRRKCVYWGLLGLLYLPLVFGDDKLLQNMKQECLQTSFKWQSCHYFANWVILKDIDTDPASDASYYLQDDEQGESFNNASIFLGDPYSINNKVCRVLSTRVNFFLLIKNLLAKTKKEHLMDCQKACLATCVSSKIIKYSYILKEQKTGNPILDMQMEYFKQQGYLPRVYELKPNVNEKLTGLGAIEKGEGVCRQFSYIAVNLMRSLGLEAEEVVGHPNFTSEYRHEVVKVKINEENYLMEPQDDLCNFYPVGAKVDKNNPNKMSYLENTDLESLYKKFLRERHWHNTMDL